MGRKKQVLLRIGAVAVVLSMVLQLAGCSGGEPALGGLQKAAVFLTTGRVLTTRPPQTTTPVQTQPPTEPTKPTEPPQTQPETPLFTQADASLLSLSGSRASSVDKALLLTRPLSWDLFGEGPTVLILHTHGSESYENTEGYTPSSDYRTLDESYNMVSIGDEVARRLEQAGIGVVHDRTLHDYPSYNGSYVNSRAAMEEYLAQYPTVRLVLDLHRDAAEDGKGNQVRYTVSSPYGKAAKLMFVMGSHTDGRPHKNWQENLALALKLQVLLERAAPGITRPTAIWASRLNQDLSPGAVLVEVGTAGNTRQEALNGAAVLADAIIALGKGA